MQPLRSLRRIRLRDLAIAILCLLHPSAGTSQDAFWHGVISSSWDQGIIGVGDVASNWYSLAPPNGDPLEVPTGTARFFPGAITTTVNVPSPIGIKSIVFGDGVELYQFLVDAPMLIDGDGLSNVATGPKHLFSVRSGGRIDFAGNSQLTGSPISIDNEVSQGIWFRENSKGGSTEIFNLPGGSTGFFDRSEAENMLIVNRRRSTTSFRGRSNPGRAEFRNEARGRLLLSTTKGPRGNDRITSGEIENNGFLALGQNRLNVRGTFRQRGRGVLRIDIAGRTDFGSIRADNARLGGRLIVNLKGAKMKSYTVISAKTIFRGKFSRVQFIGGKASVEYRRGAVVVVVE